MNDSDPEENNSEIGEPSVNDSCPQPHLSPSHKMIEIQVASKKKKEVINLDSSSQKIGQNKPLGLKGEEKNGHTSEKVIKPKKTLPKCQLCKGTGKKVEMKTCIGCKLYFHLACLEENEAKKKFLCEKCRAQQMSQSKVQKKQKKQQQKLQAQLQSQISPNILNLPNNYNKTTLKKLEKEKKREQSNRCFRKFQQKYSYYIGENQKIKFPIQDKLLFIYKDYFETNQNRPAPSEHPMIPKKYLGDFMQLENFIVSFSREIQKEYSGQFKKSMLYLIMNSEGSDKVFEQLLGAIIKIYLKDIFEKNKTENVKILNDHAFFILLGTLNEDDVSSQIISIVAPEIIRHLSTVPSMKDAFKKFQFPEKLNLETKLKTLIELIQGLSEVDGFHDMVSRKSEKISQMTKDKADFVSHLKKNEAQALCNKQKIKEIQSKINEVDKKQSQEQNINQKIQNGVSPTCMNPKQIEKSKKKSQKLSNQHQLSSKLIKEFREKITQITKTIPFTISEIMFLGSDRNKSYYYFYLREPNRIYVRYHAYCMDQKEDYLMYEGKQKIIELMKTLNNKGINQKRLGDNISFLLKEQIIHNLTQEEKYREFQAGKYQAMQNEIPSNYIHTQQQFKNKVITDVMDMQEKFSNYLVMKSCQWASEGKREQFRLGFPYIDDLQAMKEAIKTLQENFLFVEVFKERDHRINNQSDSNEEHNDKSPYNFQEKQLIRRKKPIRIWGINSEKIKKFWHEYLETCIDYIGIWISVNIFKSFVDKYLDKKLEYLRQQERKQTQERQRQNKRIIRQIRDQENQQRRAKQVQQKARATRSSNTFQPEYELSLDQFNSRRPNLRSRNKNPKQKNNRRKNFTIDSDEEQVQDSQVQQHSEGGEMSEEQFQEMKQKNKGRERNGHENQRKKRIKKQKYQQESNLGNSENNEEDANYEDNDSANEDYKQEQEQSNNEEECGICKEVGDVICCDTCPKVYHLDCLKLKQVPEGEWSCMDCLRKLANTRQTRSRAKTSK